MSDKLQTRSQIIYFSSNMTFQTEIFQGMFSTTCIIISRPYKFISVIFTIFVSYQFGNVPLILISIIIVRALHLAFSQSLHNMATGGAFLHKDQSWPKMSMIGTVINYLLNHNILHSKPTAHTLALSNLLALCSWFRVDHYIIKTKLFL